MAQTAEDGTFRLNGLPAGRYALAAVSEHWRSDERSVPLGVAQVTQPIDLILRAATRLTGVVKVGGVPCEQGSVSLNGAVESYAPVEPEGSVAFDGIIPGRYQISVECDASLGHREWLDIGLEPLTRVWELEQGLRVTGVALTSAGVPVVGAAIEVNPVNAPFGRARVHCVSDERGEFSCAGLAAGEYECAIGQGVPARSDSIRVVVSAESSPRVVLHTRAEGAIRVRIENAEQFELLALPLVARGQAGAVLGKLEGDEFVFEPLALGSYQIASDSSPPGSGSRVELTRDSQVAELTLALPSAHTLSGRVVDDDGHGIPDAWVRAAVASLDARVRPVTPVLTDGEGAFSLMGLLPGRYRLAVSSSQGEAQLDGIASDSSGVLVRLRSYGSLAVSLSNSAGGPVRDFVIAYRRSEDDWGNEVRGSHGAWSVPWVAPGHYELTAKAAEAWSPSSAHACSASSCCSSPAAAQSLERAPRGRFAKADDLDQVVLWFSQILVRHAGVRNEVSFSLTYWSSVLPPSTRTRDDALVIARQIAEQAAEDPKRFAELARQHSEDVPSRDEGGAVGGYKASALMLWPQVLDALAALRPGQSSQVVETKYGFHVFYRSAPPLKEVMGGTHLLIGHEKAPWLEVFARDKAPNRSREEALSLANDLYRKASAEPARFAALVKEYSEHMDAIAGGDFGDWSTREGVPYPARMKRLGELAVGEVGAPIETHLGFEIIRRTPVRPRKQYRAHMLVFPFDEVNASAPRHDASARKTSTPYPLPMLENSYTRSQLGHERSWP